MCMLNAVAHQSSMQELDLLNPQLDPRISYTGGPKSYVGADGLLHQSAANAWPLEYDPITLKPIGRSVWEQRTNLCAQSIDFSSASWTKSPSGVGVAPVVTPASALAPDGTMTATLVTLNKNGGATTNDWSWLYYDQSAIAGSTYSLAVWLQAATPADVGKAVKLTGAGGVGANIVLTASPQRVSYSGTPGVSSTYSFGVRLRGTEGTADSASFYMWGFSIEQAAFAGPYIPTAGSQVTRVADVPTVNPIGKVRFNDAGLTVLLRGITAADSGILQRIFALSNGSTTNRAIVSRRTDAKAEVLGIAASTTIASTLTSNGIAAANTNFAVAARLLGGVDYAICLDGGTVAVDDTVTGDPVGIDRLEIGSHLGVAQINGVIKAIRVYPGTLAELRALTA